MSVVPFRKRSEKPAEPVPRDVASAIRAGQRGTLPAGRLIVVGGGKGGTGKSVLAANLGVLSSLRGQRTSLVDADFGLANLHLLLGVEPEANLLRLLEPGWASSRLRGALVRQGPAGVRLLPGASGAGRMAGLNRGELRRLIQRLEPYVRDSEMLVADLSAGLSPPTRLFLRAAREVVVVANPEPTAVLDAYGVIKLLAESDHLGDVHLVMNRAHDTLAAQDCARRIRDTAAEYLKRQVNFLGCVPEDAAVQASVQRRRPVVLDSPQSPAAAALRSVFQQLMERKAPGGSSLSAFFSTAKALVAPRRRTTKSSCAL